MNRFAHDLHAYFVTGARIAPSSQASSLTQAQASH
jgi:hypothetical protein